MATYYAQRASVGLIITEATGSTLKGSGWPTQVGCGMRNMRSNVGHIDCRLRDPLPEAKAIGSGVVANQVQSNPHQPRQDRAVSPKTIAGRPGTDKGVLRQRLGEIAVADRDQVEAEYPLFIRRDDGRHVVQWRCRRMLRHGVAVGGDGA